MVRSAVVSLALLAGGVMPAAVSAHARDGAVAQAEDGVGAFLDRLERAESALNALWCEVVYDRRFVLQGDRQIRIGTLAFERSAPVDEDADPARAFSVDFATLIVGDEVREDRQSWTFRDRWLVERRFEDKVYVMRELAPPGKTLDPLRLGQGPMPLPIGQKKADILARYTVELVGAGDGFDADDASDDGYEAYARGATQIRLTPRKDVPDADEKFREIRLWYRSDDAGGLIPVLARTVDRSADVIFVQLVGVKRAETLPADRVISIDPPAPDAGWDVQVERGRFDEDLESVRIGRAMPTRNVGFVRVAYQPSLPPTDASGERGGLSDLSPLARGEDREAQPIEAPNVSASVLRAVGASYLSEEERAERRVFHGLWTASDLASVPGAAARAALDLGVWDHPSFDDDPFTDPLDRAEALVRRGELVEALDAIGIDDDRVRAMRLRAEALDGLGRFDEAIGVLARIRDGLLAGRYATAQEVTDACRGVILLARLTGLDAGTYQTMLTSLTEAHQRLDRLYWPAVVVESRLLDSKGNAHQAVEAAQQALAMSPAAHDAWAILGLRSVMAFDSARSLGVTDRLDRLERRLAGDDAHSPAGDLIAARMYLRLNDPELASLRVEHVLARYPRHREALALRCAVAATRYDFGLLEEELSAFDRLSPGHPLALFEAGSALSERRQYKEASAYLNRAIERAPNWAEPLVELGLMEVQAARDVIAKDALERAVALDPFHTRAKNSLALVEGLLAEFATMESEHFVVRYQPGPDEVLAREMLVELEAMHDELVEVLEHTPARKTLMELMPTHDWFSVRITGMPQIHTVAAATGPIIAMEAPKVGKGHTGVYDWLRVARHEYAHTITLDRTGNRIPLWFTEAAAVAMEDAPRDYNRVRLLSSRLASNELFDLEEIDLGFIRPEKQSDRAQAYAQAQWIWEFIDETWGGPANLEMMDRFARGERVPGVLDEMFGLTQRAFMSRFTEWAWEDARTWGVFAEPSLDALRMEETLADPELGPDAIGDLRRFARSVTRASATGARVERFDPQLITVTPELVGFWSELHPDHPDVLELRVDAMLDSRSDGPTMDDAELLRAYARARPTDPKPHRHLARLFLRSDDPARAIPHLEFLDDREIYSPAYAVALARRYAERADYDRALASARKAVRVSPFDGDYRELAATVAIRAERFDEARHHLEALTVLEPTIEQHKRRLEALDRLATRPG